jgi:hypothetical protein
MSPNVELTQVQVICLLFDGKNEEKLIFRPKTRDGKHLGTSCV